jgi:hypothetical protein
MKKGVFLVVLFLSCFSIKLDAQDSFKKMNSTICIENDIYVIDTIAINHPVLLSFKEKDRISYVLIHKEKLDSLEMFRNSRFEDFVFSNGYLCFLPYSFVSMLENLLWENKSCSNMYKNILANMKQLRLDKTPWFSEEAETYKEWHYYEACSNRFVFCLIKGSFVKKWFADDYIQLKSSDNIYYKVLVPIKN